MNHLLGGIAQPDPIPAPHHAASPSVAPPLGQLGALLGAAAFLPALARRRPAKFFGGLRFRKHSHISLPRGPSYRVEVLECGKSRLEIEKKRRMA